MTADRHELHELVDELPEDQVASAINDVRRRMPKPEQDRPWPPAFFGIIDGSAAPNDVARNLDLHLAAYGFGRDSL